MKTPYMANDTVLSQTLFINQFCNKERCSADTHNKSLNIEL